ncbi:carbohydrate ABC transporter membrane protein 2, CUT1 family (TC 3.A.1.1.-) [Anaerocolumna jejuensis DSM 15929]|uniref:Carbohydrate ABC transporter membrane protein 2, CUT1 family (TC 3.A.1.1.-) n=1 Tax=Anaerocolumna jejuensis DSM 15929 TaxID=1121322 RepID=A0A1M6UD80_9FIRM|nr:carbohydrate ABC transporter permease [Anaerocolumna jejuensis]SHK67008.1 carbohydrate ABC transporter membrane protein 2, CUT1 family (TC 3.A.1.1.-) [Anaerocolumna jejuensis DSM 15929]
MSNIDYTITVKSKKRRLNSISLPAEVIINIILGLFCLACVLPFIFVVIISFSSQNSIREIGFSFVPKEWSLNAYKYIMDLGAQLWVSYFNSFFVTILGTILSVLMCVLYSYALFRKDFKYRRFFTFFSFFTMLFGGGLAPTYMVCKNMLGLSDNYAALIVPMLINPFNIIIMRTFFQSSVPTELIESAAIDGSGEYNTLFKIIVPISKPGIATVALLNALAYWNEWFIPMLYIKKAHYIPLQYLLMKMQNQADFLVRNAGVLGAEASKIMNTIPQDTLRMALVVLIVIPIACAYPFFQRFIISGLTIGSVKG